MHYEIDYTDRPEWIAKVDAMKDTQDFLGKVKFRKVVKALQGDYTSSKRMLHFALGLAGIQGYPAQVMIDLYAPKQLKLFQSTPPFGED